MSASALYPPASWPPAETLVLLCARVTWDEPVRQQVEAVLRGPVDWDCFLALARVQQLGPLAYYHLRSLKSRLPEHVWNSLRDAYYQSLGESMVRYHALKPILAAFQQQGIPVILWKGVALAQTIYPDIALRPMCDLDLVVRPADVDRAIAALAALGYELPAEMAGPAWRSFVPEVALNRRFGKMTVTVDLHWRAFVGQWLEQVMGPEADERAIWDTAREFDYEGHAALFPAPAPGLLGLILHALLHHNLGQTVLRSLADADAWLRDYVAPAGWDDLVMQARSLRVAAPTYMALTLCQELLGTDVPPAVLSALAPSPLHRAGLRRLVPLEGCVRGNLKLSGRRRRFLWQFFLLDHPPDLFRLVWRVLCPPRRWLEGRYALDGSRSAYLRYRLTHLLRVILRAQAG